MDDGPIHEANTVYIDTIHCYLYEQKLTIPARSVNDYDCEPFLQIYVHLL